MKDPRLKSMMDPKCGAEVELRQVFEADDFGAEFTPGLRAQEERLRAQTEANKAATV